jgi:hypothetical protein
MPTEQQAKQQYCSQLLICAHNDVQGDPASRHASHARAIGSKLKLAQGLIQD